MILGVVIDGQAAPQLRGAHFAHLARMAARTYSSHQYKAGTPDQIADHMTHWLKSGGCDGFILMPAQVPDEFQLFVDQRSLAETILSL